MQRGKHRNIPKRLRYYQGNIDLDLISKGEDYKWKIKAIILKVLLPYVIIKYRNNINLYYLFVERKWRGY